ncbi:MAG: hypothetical protein D6724_01170 [Armatimonadetes bacterium]|nr:MAG: hypothetical protein D6724_01170 [Armatimonadota bacterium]
MDPDHGVSGNISDAGTIKDAIEIILDEPSHEQFHWTVLVNPGEYTVSDSGDAIELGGTAENISIVGVNPESCIINVTASGVPGIKITSGTEDVRNNAIRNLTVKTASGHGIEIVKGSGQNDKTPKGIKIENCIIRADGANGRGIEVHTVEDLFVLQSEVRSDDAEGVHFESGQGSPAQSLHKNVLFEGCTISGKDIGAEIQSFTSPFVIRNCTVEGRGPSIGGTVFGIRYDKPSSPQDVLEVIASRAIAVNEATNGGETIALFRDPGSVRSVGCTFEARTAKAPAYGIKGGNYDDVRFEFIDCVFMTSCDDEKQPEVFDIWGEVTTGDKDMFVRGCDFSKWFGVIQALGPPRTQVDRILNVNAASDTAIHSGIQLSGSEQEVTTGITNPDTYRALKVVGVGTWSGGVDVWIIGTNLAGDSISERISLPCGTNPSAEGKKPFRTVTKIIVPAAELGQNQTIQVGTTDKLGLSSPLSSSSDVLQWSKVSGSVWQIQTSTLTVDVNHATLKPGSIASGDSFEFVYRTVR